MSGKSGKVKETASERAQAAVASDQYSRFKQTGQRAQKYLIGRTTGNLNANRTNALGTASGDVASQFGTAADSVRNSLSLRGARLGSGRNSAATTGLAGSQAQSRGLSLTGANEAIDDQQHGNIANIIGNARGEVSSANQGLSSLAAFSANQAQSDAAIAAANASGRGELIGTGVGLAAGGLSAYLSRDAEDK